MQFVSFYSPKLIFCPFPCRIDLLEVSCCICQLAAAVNRQALISSRNRWQQSSSIPLFSAMSLNLFEKVVTEIGSRGQEFCSFFICDSEVWFTKCLGSCQIFSQYPSSPLSHKNWVPSSSCCDVDLYHIDSLLFFAITTSSRCLCESTHTELTFYLLKSLVYSISLSSLRHKFVFMLMHGKEISLMPQESVMCWIWGY